MVPTSPREHPTFMRSFSFAWEGFVTAVKTERNIKIMLAIGAAALITGFVVGLSAVEWCIVLICCGLVIHAELANTAIEAVVDLTCDELHPLAKRAKDIAAASVWALSLLSVLVGFIVYARALGLLS